MAREKVNRGKTPGKVGFFGPVESGKTQLLRALSNQQFDPNYEHTTVGLSFLSVPSNEEGLDLQLADVSGNPNQSQLPGYIKGFSDISVICIDQSNPRSLEQARDYAKKIREVSGEQAQIIIAVTKADKESNISKEEIEQFKTEFHITSETITTSAKTGDGIKQLQDTLSKAALEENISAGKTEEITPGKPKEIIPEQLEAEPKKKKKVALVDVDGCLLQNGELNQDLVKRLQEGNYDEIVLFTQRSKLVQSMSLPKKIMAEDRLKSTADAVSALSEALNRPIKVSTSVDTMLGGQLAYFDQLASFEERFLQLKLAEDKGPLSAEDKKLKEDLEKEIEQEKAAILKYKEEHPKYKSSDKDFYPVDKLRQLKHLRKELTKDGSELEEDYFDDAYPNLENLKKLEQKPNRFLVLPGQIVPFDEVQEKLSQRNAEIEQLKTEYEELIQHKLKIDLSQMQPEQIKDLEEPGKTAVTHLNKLKQIKNWIDRDSVKQNFGKALDTAEHNAPTVQNIKQELRMINIQFAYHHATLEHSRPHKLGVTAETIGDDDFKERYQHLKGDMLKTQILLNFKAKIDEYNSAEEIDKFLKKYKDTNEYTILKTGQGAFTQKAHALGLENWSLFKTSSVKALEKIVEDAKEEIALRNKNSIS
ncbi:substrate of the Dot/Icm secretion system [Legionella steigerwaltii]|uniref:Multifunctional virulence effector protein DrrA n=1 Tax=Legionella steigerwaltii TaxID=460 RepID=A0A378L9N7_9GAMM|nr:ADP-ribosylation factor-like protein [Legionella steigerwaltii]KTD77000.1 multifunctional virulence effector protein DrrA [Legionella steigerwaltii]STY22429.1 substrate of the Dot/Icm secretion system [Legionella steigerwaltii]